MKISELFWKTHTSSYITIGDGVDYNFEEDGDTLFIFFQGSSQKVDWLQNFNFPRKPYKDMDISYRVHGGFLKCWKQVEDIIIKKITETKLVDSINQRIKEPMQREVFKFNRIIVSGYSHGGALAQFCHECVWYHRPDIRSNCWSYGFEAPRIYAGFKVKKELRDRWSHFLLVRNHKDIVTHCPPRLFGFCDVGTVLHIGRFQHYEGWDPVKSHYPQMVRDSLEEVDFNIYLNKGEN